MGTVGAASVTLQFASPIGQLSFAFATTSGQVHVDMQDATGRSLYTATLAQSTSIAFADASLKGGTLTLPSVGAVSKVVISTVGSDADLRIDSVAFVAYSQAAAISYGDAPLPLWSYVALALMLAIIGFGTHRRRWSDARALHE
jgi:hypothetical protein